MFRKFLGPLLVAAAALALGWALFSYVRDDIADDARLRFERQAADAKHVIEQRLRAYVEVTYGLRALFGARDAVTRAEFHRYVNSLDLPRNYPGFVQLNYAHHVAGEERNAFEASVRGDTSVAPGGYPAFAIRPPGDRPEYHVLVYIEPMQGNEFAFGLDIRMIGASGKNMDNLRETDGIISSGRLLNVGKDKAVGLAMRLPVHRAGAPVGTAAERRAAFVGSVGAGYNVRKLMTGVLDETTMIDMRYRLFDAGAAGQPRLEKVSLLFDSAQGGPGAPQDDFVVAGAAPVYDAVLPMELAGRNWELLFSAPRSAFSKNTDAVLPWLALAATLLSGALLFAWVYTLASARERAVALAGEITRELRESEASLAHAQALARLGSWTLDTRTNAMTWSAETYRLLELDPAATAPGLEVFLAWLDEADRASFRDAVERAVRSGVPDSLEFALRRDPGETRWAYFVLQPIGAGQLRGTIMDVTERKRALEIQRDLLHRLVSLQEGERRRFSANLHDLVGQSLSVLGIGLATVRGMLPGAPSRQAEAAFNDMDKVLKETMGSVREVMSDLRPPLLDDYGLHAALEWHIKQLAARTGLSIVMRGDRLEPRPAADVEVALFRIAQEALTNVAKHAGASRATVALSGTAAGVRLVVEDDGRGMPEKAAANDPGTPGWGMAVMRERAVAVGGDLRIESLGQGTRIVVEIGR